MNRSGQWTIYFLAKLGSKQFCVGKSSDFVRINTYHLIRRSSKQDDFFRRPLLTKETSFRFYIVCDNTSVRKVVHLLVCTLPTVASHIATKKVIRDLCSRSTSVKTELLSKYSKYASLYTTNFKKRRRTFLINTNHVTYLIVKQTRDVKKMLE